MSCRDFLACAARIGSRARTQLSGLSIESRTPLLHFPVTLPRRSRLRSSHDRFSRRSIQPPAPGSGARARAKGKRGRSGDARPPGRGRRPAAVSRGGLLLDVRLLPARAPLPLARAVAVLLRQVRARKFGDSTSASSPRPREAKPAQPARPADPHPRPPGPAAALPRAQPARRPSGVRGAAHGALRQAEWEWRERLEAARSGRRPGELSATGSESRRTGSGRSRSDVMIPSRMAAPGRLEPGRIDRPFETNRFVRRPEKGDAP